MKTDRFNLLESLRHKPETIRKKYLRNAIYLTLALTLFLIFFTSQALIRARAERSNLMLGKKIEIVEMEFINKFNRLENDMKLITRWGKKGVLDLNNQVQNLDNKLIPIIEEYPFLISFCLISSDSSYYALNKTATGWQSFLTRFEDSEWRFSANPDTSWLPDPDLLDLIRNGRLYAIVFSSETASDEPSMGAAHPLTDERAGASKMVFYEHAGLMNLATFNIDTDYIEKDIQKIKISPRGQVYLIPRYRFSYLAHDEDEENLKTRDTTNIDKARYDRLEILDRAIESWYGQEPEEPFNFRYKGDLWRGKARLSAEQYFSRWVVVVLPVDELFVELDQERNQMIIFTFIILLGGGLLLGILIKLYNRPFPSPISENELREDVILRKLIAGGESDNLEFKSTLRWNLKADKQDVNIEKAALKTLVAYLNSSGGTLLVGVEDDGTILGLEPDRFPNEDKYMLHLNNLIQQHIGLEFTKYIHYRLVSADDKKVLRIDCEKSADPAFLCYQEDEDFYIRVGPASRKLSTKQTLSFLLKKDNVR